MKAYLWTAGLIIILCKNVSFWAVDLYNSSRDTMGLVVALLQLSYSASLTCQFRCMAFSWQVCSFFVILENFVLIYHLI